ncbi:MAG: hypothetical protein IJV64_06355, partial [Oscillospiraceae bacterium]|nr:hypothetical protein [Oscillospiraceae bacterium]
MSNEQKKLLLDVRIPYCVRPERYQNRVFAVGSNAEKNAYMAALKREVLSWEGELDGYEIQAVRLSGGSATVMSPDLLGDLLTTIRKVLPVKHDAEVSVDAHPLTIGTPPLTGIAAGHPTRIELMMRSDSEEELKTLGCAFQKQHVRNDMLFLNRFPMNNLGLTVNVGIPGQTEASWHNTLHACTIMRPGHITLEPCVEQAGEGEALPDAQTRFALYAQACEFLEGEGYRQYAARHFCLPQHGFRYALLRMDGAEVLGLGAGAVSRFDGYLTRGINKLSLYIQNAGDFEKTTAEALEWTEALAMRDYLAQRLCSTEGLEVAAFEARFQTAIPTELEAMLQERAEQGLLLSEPGRYRPTRKGLYEAAKEND